MAKFEELNANILNIMLKLIESQNLCKYLAYVTDEETNPLDQGDIENPSSLFFDRIFPIPKIPTDSEVGSFLTVIFEDIRPNNNTYYKDSILSFNIMCHIDVWRMPGMLRPYAIASEIDKLFNNQVVVGIGRTNFERARLLWINNKFAGYKLEYRIIDFN